MKKITLSAVQTSTVKDALIERLLHESDVLADAFNYELSREEVWSRHTLMMNIKLILTQHELLDDDEMEQVNGAMYSLDDLNDVLAGLGD